MFSFVKNIAVDKRIRIEDYTYDLPQERIARYPLDQRDASKILIFKDDSISESVFSNLRDFIPPFSLMIFNDTKVVPARLFFKKLSGASVEVFCLEPSFPEDYSMAFAKTCWCEWKCAVGNAKRWKSGYIYFDNHTGNPEIDRLGLAAALVSRDEGSYRVRFEWKGDVPFSEVLSLCGNLPIPPYLHRNTESIDLERYQTLYAKYNGSVAAPTAGLHFTDKVFSDLDKAGVVRDEICLHVGAGTFLPVKSEYVNDHKMHEEVFIVKKRLLKNLMDAMESGRKIISVGTTSTRTLESLYFMGARMIETGKLAGVGQWDPYEREYGYSAYEAISALHDYLDKSGMDEFSARTGIIIVPGYKARIIDVLITNFHQPQSTLLLLIAAFIGDKWKEVYDYALSHGFRFLSYGDSSILYLKKP